MRTQPLHGHQDSVTLTTMVSPRPGLILQHSIKQAASTIHPVHQGATCIFGCFQSIQEPVGRVLSLLLREPHTHTCPTNKINLYGRSPQPSSAPCILPHAAVVPDRLLPCLSGPPRGDGKPASLFPHVVVVVLGQCVQAQGANCLGNVERGLSHTEDSSLTYRPS